MKLLLLYGLFLFGLCQCAWAAYTVPHIPPSDLIVAPDPEVDVMDPNDNDIQLIKNDINLCSNMADLTLLPYVGNCSSFISCINGTESHTGSCYEKQYDDWLCKGNYTDCEVAFDSKDQACVFMSDSVKCLPQCEKYNLTSFCYDGTCTKYVLCYYGVPVLRECYDGLQYNEVTDRCDFPEYVDCVDNECPQHEDPANIVYIPSKAQCDKYFICSDGMPWIQECTKGLVFNPQCKCCDYASKVNCTLTAQQRNIQPYSRSPPRRADIICPANGVHFYPHKSRQDAYYYCVNGHGITLDCTPGLLYDSKINECRLPIYIVS